MATLQERLEQTKKLAEKSREEAAKLGLQLPATTVENTRTPAELAAASKELLDKSREIRDKAGIDPGKARLEQAKIAAAAKAMEKGEAPKPADKNVALGRCKFAVDQKVTVVRKGNLGKSESRPGKVHTQNVCDQGEMNR